MKKITLIVIIALLAITLSGCGVTARETGSSSGGGSGSSSPVVPTQNEELPTVNRPTNVEVAYSATQTPDGSIKSIQFSYTDLNAFSKPYFKNIYNGGTDDRVYIYMPSAYQAHTIELDLNGYHKKIEPSEWTWQPDSFIEVRLPTGNYVDFDSSTSYVRLKTYEVEPDGDIWSPREVFLWMDTFKNAF